ncbi:hypothetical protein H9P43_001126 [Blastocladiella emersonii ATCC 22665]|nr:hypothetical protein H9P43_001126 [Blastocladiella emersonii ATCC 22665]
MVDGFLDGFLDGFRALAERQLAVELLSSPHSVLGLKKERVPAVTNLAQIMRDAIAIHWKKRKTGSGVNGGIAGSVSDSLPTLQSSDSLAALATGADEPASSGSNDALARKMSYNLPTTFTSATEASTLQFLQKALAVHLPTLAPVTGELRVPMADFLRAPLLAPHGAEAPRYDSALPTSSSDDEACDKSHHGHAHHTKSRHGGASSSASAAVSHSRSHSHSHHAHSHGSGHAHAHGHPHHHHGHGHGHGAADPDSAATRKLWLASGLCFVFFIIELIGGILSQSLAIYADSFHLLSDLSGFLISLAAIYLARRKATKEHSFGFHRAEVLGAIISILLIWVVTAFLVVEAIDRLRNPLPINGRVMLGTAAMGLVVNLILIFALGHGHDHGHGHGHSHGHHGHSHGDEEAGGHHHHHHHNINLNAAFIHVLGDTALSVGVLIAAAIITWRPDLVIVDPICTFIFSFIVMGTTVGLIRDSIGVLMEGTPAHIDPHAVEADLARIPNVLTVHDLHIWTLTMGKAALAVHIEVPEDILIHEYDAVLEAAQNLVCSKYAVHHTTIQLETTRGIERNVHCKSSICQGGVCQGPPPAAADAGPSSSSPNVQV